VNKNIRSSLLLAIGILFFFGCSTADRMSAASPPVAGAHVLKVALYPYVPRKEQFKAAVSSAWRNEEPNVELQFVEDWDCYSNDPRDDLDVFVFDAIFLDHFEAGGFLERIPEKNVSGLADFFGYALEGSKVHGALYGIPQLGCANILFYRREDQALASAKNLSDVTHALGECTYAGEHPPPGIGLLVDLSGGTTTACLYLNALEDIFGQYTPAPPLPPDESKIDPWAIQNLWKVLRLASKPEASYEDPGLGYERAAWFGRGEGRALVGYTESMSNMGEQARADLAFKLMPLADQTDVSLFYADIVGINTTAAKRGNRELALKLADLMASAEVMVKCIGPTGGYNYPQYLMPVRPSVFKALESSFPLYGKMYRMVNESSPNLFRISADSRIWLANMKKQIRVHIFAAPDCQVVAK
jgi:thiamine pyridinylase